MLGKGLESLIPDKGRSQGGSYRNDFSVDEYGDGGRVSDAGRRVEQFSGTDERAMSRRTMPEPASPAPVMPTDSFRGEEKSHELNISGPIFHIEVEKIVLNPYQPRKSMDEESLRELAASIRELGILQPLVVTKVEKETEYGSQVIYQLIAGHRRLMASKMLGMGTVPVVIRKTNQDAEALELAVVENIQRSDLSAIETARAFARLSDEFGLTQREIATRLGKSREAIANALRLLALPTQIQNALMDGSISESHARLLLQVKDISKQQALFEKVVSEQISVRDLKRIITKGERDVSPRPPSVARRDVAGNVEMKDLEKSLSEFLGAPVRVDVTQNGGKIIIHFYSPEEAQGIVQRIKPEEY